MNVRPAIKAMEAYHPPLDTRTAKDYLLLDFNESVIPPHPRVLQAMQEFIAHGRIRMYPAYGSLLEKLGRYVGVAPEQLLLTNGSDGAIQCITHALLEGGDEMVMPTPGFFVLRSAAEACGATVVMPPYEEDMRFPLQGVLDAVTPRTRMIAIISPNNPTGTCASQEQIEAILKAHPDVAVFVDEAYYEFSGETAVPLLARYDNLVITRTFSKALAIAGMRLGYAVGRADFIAELSKIRIPYDVNSLAAVAADALLDDPAPWQAYAKHVMTQAKPMVERFFDEHGVKYYRSQANFMLVVPDSVREATAFLEQRGILVRPQRAPVDNAFRLSVGRLEDMRRFCQAYGDYLASRTGQAAQG